MLLVLLVTLGISAESSAIWQSTAWNVFKEVAMDTAIDVVQSFFKDDVKPEEVTALKGKVSDLERQLYSFKEGRDNPPDFGSVEETVLRLTKIVNAMESRFSSLEDRVTILEKRVTIIEQDIPFVKRTIAEWKGNKSRLTYNGYTVNPCGSITDSKTRLEWYIGPDRNMTWDEAKEWTQQLSTCGGQWRMPKIREIKTLYDPNYTAGIGYYTKGQHYPAHIHPVFDAIGGGSWVWANETIGIKARSFNLNQGIKTSYSRQNITYSTRAFAVR
jgi:hypothetical protein